MLGLSAAAAAFAASLLSPAASACADARCRCVTAADRGLTPVEQVREWRQRADAVVLARVVAVDTLAAPDGGSGPVVARLLVARAWHGAGEDTLTVAVTAGGHARSSCDTWLTEGQTYLVFAGRRSDGLLWTAQCTGTQRAEVAGQAIAVLDADARRDDRAPRPRP